MFLSKGFIAEEINYSNIEGNELAIVSSTDRVIQFLLRKNFPLNIGP